MAKNGWNLPNGADYFREGDHVDYWDLDSYWDGEDWVWKWVKVVDKDFDKIIKNKSSGVIKKYEDTFVDLTGGDDSIAVVLGGRNHDMLVDAGAGNDKIRIRPMENEGGHSGFGTVTVLAGTGNDTIDGGGTRHKVKAYGGEGEDTLIGGKRNDRLAGGDDNDTLYGNRGDDLLVGEGGSDRIFGGDGSDKIFGGSGNDYMVGGKGHDYIEGNSGEDEIRGGEGNDRIRGGSQNDLLLGENGDDYIGGGSGNDTIYGGRGSDELRGGEGDDFIHTGTRTGEDIDQVWGGPGGDLVVCGQLQQTYMPDGSLPEIAWDEWAAGRAGVEGKTIITEVLKWGAKEMIDTTAFGLVFGMGVSAGTSVLTNLIARGKAKRPEPVKDKQDYASFNDLDVREDIFIYTAGEVGSYFSIEQSGTLLEFWTDVTKQSNGGLVAKVQVDDGLVDYIKDHSGTTSSTEMITKQLAEQLATHAFIVRYENGTYYDGNGALSSSDLDTDIGGKTLGEHLDDLGLSDGQVIAMIGAYAGQVLEGENITNATTNLFLAGTEFGDAIFAGNAQGGEANVWATLFGFGGDDLIVGSQKTRDDDDNDSDWMRVYGDQPKDSDRLYGGDGDDELHGLNGDDELYGEGDNDTLYGGDGDDRLDGGAGDDWLVGDAGSDTFVFSPDDAGSDTIVDFEDDIDEIDLSAFNFASVEEAMDHAMQVGDDVQFVFDTASQLTLLDTQLNQIADDLMIA